MQKIILSFITLSVIALALLVISACLPSKKMPTMPIITNAQEAIALFPTTPDQIKQNVQQAQENTKRNLGTIIKLNPEERTFANTAKALDVSEEAFSIKAGPIQVVQYVHPDQAMRDASKKAIIELQQFAIDNFSNNIELYRAFQEYVQGNAQRESLNDEQQYFIKETMKAFKRAGLDLPEEKRNQVADLKKKIAELALEFDTNINADKSSIIATREELAGLDDDFINTLKHTQDGTYTLFCDYPTLAMVMDHCTVVKTRKNFYRAFVNRAYPKNVAILEKIITLRDQLAKLIGFASYAHFDIDEQMAKSPYRVQQFLDDLVVKAHKKTEKEFNQWRANLPQGVTLTENKKIKPWDLSFIKEQYKQRHLKLDDRKVAEYFPMENTVKELLDIYQQFFSLKFKEVPASGAWHEDVKLIEVRNASDNVLYGYLFLDLHPRPNKYSHAAHTSIMHGKKNKKEMIVQPTISVVLANFPKSTATKPSLLKHDDVTTFFHEFGHAMHSLLGATELASFAGTQVKADFVEMPSQMLEEWMYEPEILNKVSSHYQTGNPLPEVMIKRLKQLKTFDSGNFITRQSFLSQAALDFYKEGAHKDTTNIYHDLYRKFNKHVALDPYYHQHASWGHLTGYASKYYGYLWARVFAADLFEQIKKYGLLNPEIGRKYKDTVLAKGGSIEPDKLLRNFLGREPNQEAFMKQMGLS